MGCAYFNTHLAELPEQILILILNSDTEFGLGERNVLLS